MPAMLCPVLSSSSKPFCLLPAVRNSKRGDPTIVRRMFQHPSKPEATPSTQVEPENSETISRRPMARPSVMSFTSLRAWNRMSAMSVPEDFEPAVRLYALHPSNDAASTHTSVHVLNDLHADLADNNAEIIDGLSGTGDHLGRPKALEVPTRNLTKGCSWEDYVSQILSNESSENSAVGCVRTDAHSNSSTATLISYGTDMSEADWSELEASVLGSARLVRMASVANVSARDQRQARGSCVSTPKIYGHKTDCKSMSVPNLLPHDALPYQSYTGSLDDLLPTGLPSELGSMLPLSVLRRTSLARLEMHLPLAGDIVSSSIADFTLTPSVNFIPSEPIVLRNATSWLDMSESETQDSKAGSPISVTSEDLDNPPQVQQLARRIVIRKSTQRRSQSLTESDSRIVKRTPTNAFGVPSRKITNAHAMTPKRFIMMDSYPVFTSTEAKDQPTIATESKFDCLHKSPEDSTSFTVKGSKVDAPAETNEEHNKVRVRKSWIVETATTPGTMTRALTLAKPGVPHRVVMIDGYPVFPKSIPSDCAASPPIIFTKASDEDLKAARKHDAVLAEDTAAITRLDNTQAVLQRIRYKLARLESVKHMKRDDKDAQNDSKLLAEIERLCDALEVA